MWCQPTGLHHPSDGITNLKYKLQCFLTTKFFWCKEKALAFNWDRCCHLAICLQLILFHWILSISVCTAQEAKASTVTVERVSFCWLTYQSFKKRRQSKWCLKPYLHWRSSPRKHLQLCHLTWIPWLPWPLQNNYLHQGEQRQHNCNVCFASVNEPSRFLNLF
jgi:hypothetical protein